MVRPRFGLEQALTTLVVVAALVTGGTAAADMRCGSKLISVGDSKARVLMACGEPMLEDLIGVERMTKSGKLVTTTLIEEWSYPNPAGADPRKLRFKGSRLVGSGIRCQGRLVGQGSSKAEVILKCGEPLLRDPLVQHNASTRTADSAPTIGRRVEQWTYRQGKGQFLRIVTFREGKVIAIENGARE